MNDWACLSIYDYATQPPGARVRKKLPMPWVLFCPARCRGTWGRHQSLPVTRARIRGVPFRCYTAGKQSAVALSVQRADRIHILNPPAVKAPYGSHVVLFPGFFPAKPHTATGVTLVHTNILFINCRLELGMVSGALHIVFLYLDKLRQLSICDYAIIKPGVFIFIVLN